MQYSFSGGTTSPSPVAASDFAGFSVVGGGGNDTLTINGGTPTLLNNIGDDGTSFSVTASTGTLNLVTAEDLASISIDSGAAVHVLGTGNALATSALVFTGTTNAWQGQLDLGSSNLIVHGGDLPTLTNQLKSGYNNGGWNGLTGIVSSSAATDITHLAALGIAANNDGSSNTLYSTFSDEFVSTTDILVKYTYYGDANLDGQVDGSDYSRIDNGYLTHATGWNNGDFNYDGSIDGSDYTLIDNAFNTQGPGIPNSNLPITVNSSDSVTLNWSPVPNAASYRVYRSINTTFDTYYNDVGDILDPTVTSFNDDNLDSGTTYFYQVYSLNTDGSQTKIGINTATTPTDDSSPDVTPGIHPLAAPALPAVTNLQATGANDSEIFVSWTDPTTTKGITGYNVEVSTDQTTWNSAGTASRAGTNFIIRGYGTTGASFLAENTTYYIRVTPVGKNRTGTVSAVVNSQVFVGDRDAGFDMIIVVGGNNQNMELLLKGISVNGSSLTGATNANSLGLVWMNLVNDGYNAYLTSDPADGGVPGSPIGLHPSDGMPQNSAPTTINATNYILANDGSGRIYDEVGQEALRANGDNQFNDKLDVGLIGYSHGGGMIYNLSQKILKDGNLNKYARVVFSATIDAVQYDPVANKALGSSGGLGFFNQSGLINSPLKGWGSPALGYNWYETKGYVPAVAKGVTGTGAYSGVRGFPFSQSNITDTLVTPDDHSAIAVNFGILNSVVSDAESQFNSLFH